MSGLVMEGREFVRMVVLYKINFTYMVAHMQLFVL